MAASPQDILDFWFGPAGHTDRGQNRTSWFHQNTGFDNEIRRLFGAEVQRAVAGDFVEWELTAASSLALLLLLDQFPRNLYRNDAQAFAGDGRARAVAEAAIRRDFDKERPLDERLFFYLPLEHSERLLDQDRSVELISALGNLELTDYAERHRDVIVKFGRFPHRNRVLKRKSTPEEEAFLKLPGSTF